MRPLIGIVGLIALVGAAFAADEADFRKVRWGMSRAEVIQAEGVQAEQRDERITYHDKIGSASVGVLLTFVDDKLASAAYLLTDRYAEPNQYVLLADQWRESVSEKYGTPNTETRWINRLYRDNPERLGFAISAGQAIVKSTWETPRTIIIEGIAGGNFKTVLGITYTSRELKPALDKQEAEKRRKAF